LAYFQLAAHREGIKQILEPHQPIRSMNQTVCINLEMLINMSLVVVGVFFYTISQTNCIDSPCGLGWPWLLVGHEQQAMVGAVEGFGGKAGDLPLHQPCGGPAVCL
jgi:hypothetical protein